VAEKVRKDAVGALQGFLFEGRTVRKREEMRAKTKASADVGEHLGTADAPSRLVQRGLYPFPRGCNR